MRNAMKVLVIAAAAGGIAFFSTGCKSDQKTDAEHPNAEHPQGEHPQGEHPEGEHPQGDHPQGDHPG